MSEDPLAQLGPRRMGRSGIAVSPIIWEMGEADVLPEMIDLAIRRGADWFLLPSPLDPAIAPARGHLAVGVSLESVLARGNRLEERFTRLPGRCCRAVLLQGAIPGDLKGGRPFHRLQQLRDKGRFDLILIDAADAPDAEWFVEHTAAHGVCLPYDPAEQTARYRVLGKARDFGVAVLARGAASHDERSLAFRLGDADVAAAVEPLPLDAAAFDRCLRAAAAPLSAEHRSALWAEFQRRVPEPPRPRGNHPPEYGA